MRSGRVAQVAEFLLVSMRLWVQTPVLPKGKKKGYLLYSCNIIKGGNFCPFCPLGGGAAAESLFSFAQAA
jgi:hypothetical protein